MNELIFVYNQESGKYNQKIHKKIIGYFLIKNIHIISIDIIRFLNEDINLEKFDGVVIGGGDGTVSSVCRKIIHTSINLPIIVLPMGTTNNFSRNLYGGKNIRKIIERIDIKNSHSIDVGVINDEHVFVNAMAGGKIISPVYETNPTLKKYLGSFAYFLHLFINVFKQNNYFKENHLLIESKDVLIEGNFVFYMISNCGSHVSINLIENSKMNDGKMELVLLKKTNFLSFINSVRNVFFKKIENDENISIISSEYFLFKSFQDEFTLDGEKCLFTPETIYVHKEKLFFCELIKNR